ncbi:cysteine proteinase [Atractiella rhizophila]|nr:cysteine proteinase [Atractiella rhizophila]
MEEPSTKRQRLDEEGGYAAISEEGANDEIPSDVEEEISLEADLTTRPTDLYLDTIHRHLLDFDFEKLCSVTLRNVNVYACLVCGKYFQGRGKKSEAYNHSLDKDHHVFVNLETKKFYILPDSYEVSDPSLDDISYLLSPLFTPQLLHNIDTLSHPTSYDLSSTPYVPGFNGLNNVGSSHLNVILHLLLHIPPLRDYFIFGGIPSSVPHPPNGFSSSHHASELVHRLSIFARRYWNPRAFKSQLSPHEFLQEVSAASGKKFRIGGGGSLAKKKLKEEEGIKGTIVNEKEKEENKGKDPLEFLAWLLGSLHRDLGGKKARDSSVIFALFQGTVRIEEQDVVHTAGIQGQAARFMIERETRTTLTPFLFLTLDLPPPPLFQDAVQKNIIPQVQLTSLLAKYDGRTTQESKGKIRRYKMATLPPFLILHVKRFTSNNFLEEKNPTVVNFPTRGVDMRDYVDNPVDGETVYDLCANITHESLAGSARVGTVWKVQVHTRNEGEERWFEIVDLVVEEINRQMVFLGETYIQVWERRNPTPSLNNVTINPPKERTIRPQKKTTKALMQNKLKMEEEKKAKEREVKVAPIVGGTAAR